MLLPLAWLLVACERVVEIDVSAAPVVKVEQGVRLLRAHCLTCHRVDDLEIDEMLGPPLWGARAHYLAHHPEPEAFVDAMTEFMLNPTIETSLMPLEVEEYGVKAPVNLPEADIRAVAWAIYAGRVERPPWAREYQRRHRDCDAVW